MEFSLAEDCSHETLSIKKPLAEEHIYFIYIYMYIEEECGLKRPIECSDFNKSG